MGIVSVVITFVSTKIIHNIIIAVNFDHLCHCVHLQLKLGSKICMKQSQKISHYENQNIIQLYCTLIPMQVQNPVREDIIELRKDICNFKQEMMVCTYSAE